MTRVIIDTDPGVDDAQAILLACAYPGVTIEAVTCVAGNIGLDRTVANACTILDAADAGDVPVFAGCATALVIPAADAAHVHGEDGLGDVGFAPSNRPVQAEHASHAIVRLANESPGEIVLAAVGPLTNIAVALRLDPALPQKIRRLVVMGGAIYGRGNTTNVSTEFNIWADPEAAHVVFSEWPELTLFSWETTVQHPFSAAQLENWFGMGTPKARFLEKISAKVRHFMRDAFGYNGLFGADPLALAVALEPEIVLKEERRYVTVELTGRYTRGQTTVDWDNLLHKPPNAVIVLEIDAGRCDELMRQALR